MTETLGVRKLGPWRSATVWLLAFGLIAAVLEVFHHCNEGQGVLRAVALLLFAAGLAVLWRWAPRPSREGLPRPVRVVLVTAVLLGIGGHTYVGLRSVVLSAQQDRVLLDQGHMALISLALLADGRNPYGVDAIVDLESVQRGLAQDGALRGCTTTPAEQLADEFSAWWDSRDPALAREITLEIYEGEQCDEAWSLSRRLGFKYGPGLLLAYAPAVALFGAAGIYVTNLLAFLGVCLLISPWAWKPHGRMADLLLLGFIPWLVPSHVRWGALTLSVNDLLPVFIGALVLLCVRRERMLLAGVLVGLAVSMKALPGLLFVVFIARNGRALVWAVITALVCLAPPLLNDPEGLVRNLVLFPFVRGTDSTALAHYVPAPFAWVLTAACCLGAAAVLLARARGALAALPGYAALAVLVMLGTSMFHNNYLLWITPFLGLLASGAIPADGERVVLERGQLPAVADGARAGPP